MYEEWLKGSRPRILGATRVWYLTVIFQCNFPSRQCTKHISIRAFLSLQNRRRPFPDPPSTSLLLLWRLHCFHTVYHEDWNTVFGTDRSQKEPCQENMGGGMRHLVAAAMETCDVWTGVLSCKSRIPWVSFPRLFLAISWCRVLNSPA